MKLACEKYTMLISRLMGYYAEIINGSIYDKIGLR